MAQRLDAFQKAELVDFLEGLYRLGGYRTQKQWALDAQYGEVAMSNAMNRNTHDGVGGYTLLKLIRAASKRAEITPTEAAQRAAAGNEEATRPDRLQELATLVGEGLARVEMGIADVARRLPGEDTPAQSEAP